MGADRGGEVGLEGAETELTVHRAMAVLIDERRKAVHPLLLAVGPPGAARAPHLVGLTGEEVVRYRAPLPACAPAHGARAPDRQPLDGPPTWMPAIRDHS